MKHYSMMLIALGLLGLGACRNNSIWPVKGKGPDEVKLIPVGGFQKINLAMDADVYYTQDSSYKVEISAQHTIQEVIEADVENGVLKLSTGRTTILKHNPIRITIHSPVIYGFDLSGRGRIYTHNSIHTPALKIRVSGHGEINVLSVNTQDLDATVSGSGNIILSGGATVRGTMRVSGSGTIKAVELPSDQSTVNVSGSGNVSLWAIEALHAQISGSGGISYKGLPTVDSKISGSGKLVHLN